MAGSRFPFVDVVVVERDLVVTSSHEHACRLEPRDSDLVWHCDLDDGTSSSGESDPASYVRWVCPELRIHGGSSGGGGPVLDVRRPGPHSDLGKAVKAFGRLLGRADREGHAARYAYTDPDGILDADLRGRIEQWPAAPHGDGVVRPAELWAIRTTHEGLVVESSSWWDSSPALDHQVGLAIEIAHRVRDAQRR